MQVCSVMRYFFYPRYILSLCSVFLPFSRAWETLCFLINPPDKENGVAVQLLSSVHECLVLGHLRLHCLQVSVEAEVATSLGPLESLF